MEINGIFTAIHVHKMVMFGTRITANYPKIKKICFPKIHGLFSVIHVHTKRV